MLGSSWGGFTAPNSPSLKKHGKPVVRMNSAVLIKESGRSKGGSAGTSRLLLEGPHSRLESHSALILFYKEKKNESTSSNFFQISPAATDFTSCSHKYTVFPTGNPLAET